MKLHYHWRKKSWGWQKRRSLPAQLIAGVFLALSNFFSVCFTSLCCSFHPRCLYHQKEKKTHTRQELISPAANSHSRWSIFPPFKMKGQNESSDLIRGPRWNRAHEIVFSFRRFTLSLCISLLLLYFIYPSFDLSTSNSLCLHKALPLRLMKSSPWLDPILDYIRFLGARFSRVIFHTRLFRPSFLI